MDKKEQILQYLKQSQGFLSGEDICEKLQVSRTAVWKIIKLLREEGYEIEAVTNKGYRLLPSDSVYNASEITGRLHTKWIGKNLTFLEETASTNLLAKAAGEGNGKHGDVFVARTQNGGRGRLGRSWSATDGGVYFTILLRPQNGSIQSVMPLTLLAGLAVCESIRRQSGLLAQIKWPNDVLVGQKKVCGILCEMATEEDHIKYIVVGIGVNVENEPFDDSIAFSLKKTGLKRSPFLAGLLDDFERCYETYFHDFKQMSEKYKEYCCTLNREVFILRNGEKRAAFAYDLTSDGELLVRLPDGTLKTVNSGEVSVRLDSK